MRAPSAPPGLKYLNLLLEVTSFTCFKHIQQWICGVKLIFSMNGQHVGDIPITFREFPWFHCKRHPLYLSSITTVLPGYHFTMVLFTYEPMSLFFFHSTLAGEWTSRQPSTPTAYTRTAAYRPRSNLTAPGKFLKSTDDNCRYPSMECRLV